MKEWHQKKTPGTATWVGKRYRVRWREHANGPQKQELFDRKIDADRAVIKLEHDLLVGDYVDPAVGRKTTVLEYSEQWAGMQPWRTSTRERNASVMRTHIDPKFGARPIASVRPSEVQAWAGELAKTLAPTTVEGVVRLFAAIMSAAVHDRVIARSPATNVRLPRREGMMHTPLTVDEVRALAAAAPAELHAAVIVAASTGLRQGELFGLTTDRVSWLAKQREIRVDRQLVTLSKGPAHLGPCKTARSVRAVPIADHVVDALAAHLAAHPANAAGLVFHRDGEPWRRNRAADEFRKLAAAAIKPGTTDAKGIDASGWHALRHHAASVLIAQGLGVTAVAATLGHSPAECLKTYAAWWPSEHEQVRSAFSRAWAPAVSE